MAVAGKVAITLSTENGGAWSADVTYDRLVAVKHNNNLYISRKTVANVEPPNDEFWFLALKGFGGDDVQTLIDRMNELSDLIQAIVDGTTPVGNAKTLDGHEAEYFAKGTDLANYLPKSGGTVMNTLNVNGYLAVAKYNSGFAVSEQLIRFGALLGYLGFSGTNNPVFKSTGGTVYPLAYVEEGTCTLTYNNTEIMSCNYCKVGKVVFVSGYTGALSVEIPAMGTINGLPFAVKSGTEFIFKLSSTPQSYYKSDANATIMSLNGTNMTIPNNKITANQPMKFNAMYITN